MTNKMPLGLKPFVPSSSDALFADFFMAPSFPTLPVAFGYENLLPDAIGMMANDRLGDCAAAEAAHGSMLTAVLGGNPMPSFTDKEVIAFYSAVTGYDPADPSTDQGTDYRVMLNYLRKTGITDASGASHKIGAFVLLQKGNLTQLDQALWLFGNVPVGVDIPSSAQGQFAAGQPWDVVAGAQIEGGHAIGGIQKLSAGMYLMTSWGRKQPVTSRFLKKYMTQAWGVVSPETLKRGKSVHGYNLTQLNNFVKAL